MWNERTYPRARRCINMMGVFRFTWFDHFGVSWFTSHHATPSCKHRKSGSSGVSGGKTDEISMYLELSSLTTCMRTVSSNRDRVSRIIKIVMFIDRCCYWQSQPWKCPISTAMKITAKKLHPVPMIQQPEVHDRRIQIDNTQAT